MLAKGMRIFVGCQIDLSIAGPEARLAERIIEYRHESALTVQDLWVKKGWRGFNKLPSLHINKEQKGFDDGAELVLAALSAHHDSDNRAFFVVYRVDDGTGNFGLIGIERLLDNKRSEAFDEVRCW